MRIILFKRVDYPVHKASFIFNQLTTLLNQLLKQPDIRIVGFNGFYLLG
ncbi:hypothetical protein H238_5478, partial [Klebsiella pneumoniae UHKPC179]